MKFYTFDKKFIVKKLEPSPKVIRKILDFSINFDERDEVLNSLNEKDLLDAQSLSIKLFKKINN